MDKEAAIRHCIACCDGALTDEQRSELSSRIGGAIEAERDACWDQINAYVKQGELPYPQHEERNGLVMACNVIRRPNR